MKTLKLCRGIAVFVAFMTCAGIAAVCVPKTESASANSGPSYWYGTTSTGVLFTGENCPLQVEKEVLTFDLNEFPKDNGIVDEFLEYSGKVTAEYTFKNPTENEITATLAFPFGTKPSYAPDYDEEGNRIKDVDTSKYTVQTDGEDASPTLRHTFRGNNDFDFGTDVKKIRDDFADDKFYKPDLAVYKYEFTATAETDEVFYSVADIPFDNTKTKIASYNYTYDNYEGVISVTWCHQTSASNTFYVIGEDIDISKIQWKFYVEKSKRVPIIGWHWYKEYVNGSAKVNSAGETTFKEFVLKDREEDDAVSEIDFYNGVLDYLNSYFSSSLPINGGSYFKNRAMRWYVYDLTVAAGQSVTNTVIAPMYPTIYGNYSPYVYGYEYYLSPAANWSSFGSLEININTPYFITDGDENFKKTDNGYSYKTNGLPQGELRFSLCLEENPEYSHVGVSLVPLIIIFLVMGAVVVLATLAVIIWAIVYSVTRK